MRYDSQTIYGVDQKGNAIFIKISLRENRLAELALQLRLENGTIFQLPEHPAVLLCSIPARKWQAGGLEINVVEPFQTLRITYNGLLRNCIRNDKFKETGQVQHCRFNFIWSAASEPKYFPQDMTTHELANAVAVEPWKNPKWIKLLGYQTGYDQYGMLFGQILVGNDSPPRTVRLTSCRKRTWGPSKARTLHRSLTLFGANNNGSIFTINVKSYIQGCKELHVGTMILPNRKVVPIEDCDISLPDFIENGVIPGAFSFSFEACGVTYDCTAFTCKTSIANMRNEETKGYKSCLVKTNYMINGEQAIGYGLFWYRHQGKNHDMPSYIIRPGIQIVEPQRKYVAPLSSPECKSEYLAGVKGTALSLLTSVESDKINLLDGFCILVPALQKHLENNLNIKAELKKLNNVACGIEPGNISDICDRVKTAFTETPLSNNLKELIKNELQYLKFKSTDIETEKTVKHCWAVRSSCVDEDLEKLPALRNATFLDCFTDEDVLKAVVLCWISNYLPEKVMYRRKHGFPIICETAVVVQYVINSETSGILTTCDPKTADPSNIVISANYGLGVSVVTNMIEPDVANVTRTWNGKLTISHTSIGSKTHHIKILKSGVGKIETIESKKFCLTSEQIYRLAEVGLLLEKTFGGPRNIEWAFYKDELYILNIKPIKFQTDWTKFDLIHENEAAILTDADCIILNTTENILPGICSNLTQSLCVKYLEKSLQRIYEKTNDFKSFVYNILSIYKQQVGINVFQSILRHVDKDITEELKIHELVTTGRTFITEKLHKEAINRNRINKLKDTVINFIRSLSYCWHSSEYAEEAKVLSQAIRIISYEEFSAFEYFNVIKRNLHLLEHIINLNTMITYSNLFYQKLILNLLHDENRDISIEQFVEMLDTYSNSSVYEIPSKLSLIGVLIKNRQFSDDFCKLNPSDALNLLEENCCDIMSLFKKFMKKFGYRGVQDLELKSEPWEANTFALIRILQLIVEKMETDEKTSQDTFEKRKRTLSMRQKMSGRILRWIETRVENSFIHKEKSLAAVSFTVNKFRFAYRELAKKLMNEGKLPDVELIFYLTNNELEKIVNKKQPDLVAKAMKRACFNKELYQHQIPDLYTGEDFLTINQIKEENYFNSRIIGNSVVEGHVKGRACVLESIRQVNNLKIGDILVVKNLDIGWSPYFPVVTGIVAESGILTSQGAIAVRKNNLPSIINAKNATNIIKTGDDLLLLANNGVVEIIKDTSELINNN